MDNIKEYIVKYKPNRIPIVTGLQQWDYGQHLIIQGIPLDELYETNVYFCFADSLKCFPSKNGIFEENEINVQIPKFIFQKQIDNCCYNEYKAYAFIYLKNGEYGKTIYKIALEIEVMPKPDEYEYDEEKLYFEELTSLLEMKADGLKYINNVLYLLAGEHILSKVTIKSGSGGGSGTDGKEVELRNDGTYIQWRYVGDEEWINLVSLEVLKGDNGITPHIGNNGNWFIGETDTGVKAEGTNGYTPQKGKDYFDGFSPIAKVLRTEQDSVYIEITDKEGKTEAFVYDGKNGITPHIGNNGNWYLGEEDTNVKAHGTDGRGIKSLEKTSSTGNVDTYTMTYTDGTKFMYNVVNASNESGGIVAETDPTVPSWAKQPQKPTYSASEVGALPNTTEIPDKTSSLTNDSGFITKAVNDLANYYLKSQTYSAEEIDNKISTIPKFSIEVVTSLPTTNISNTTVYLIASGNEQDNLYTEYIYVNSKWEYLGKQTVDLSGYVKRTELSSYYIKTEIDSLLQTIRSSIPTKLSQMTEDATHRTVTDTEKQTWNNKSNFSGNYNDLENKPNIPTKVDFIDDDLTILCDYTFNPENCKTLHLIENNFVNDVFRKAVRSIPVIIRLRNKDWGEVVEADCILADGEDGTLVVSFNASVYPDGEKFIVTIKMSGNELENGYTGTLSNVIIEEYAKKEKLSQLENQIADLIVVDEEEF